MKPPRILLIDDEDDFHDIIRQILTPQGYQILSAYDGKEGLAAIRRERPDLVLLDVNMPLMDGYAVCRQARVEPEIADIPILMLTIRRRDEEIISGLDGGADGYLVKPFEPEELLARIRGLLKSA